MDVRKSTPLLICVAINHIGLRTTTLNGDCRATGLCTSGAGTQTFELRSF